MAQFTKPVEKLVFISTLVILMWFGWQSLGNTELINTVVILAVIWWLINILLVIIYPRASSNWYGNKLIRFVAGLLVIFPAWLAMVKIQSGLLNGAEQILFLFVMIWLADSGAYFAGRRFGKRKLAPRVSPGKSWEGVIGGMLLSITAAWLMARYFSIGIDHDIAALLVFVAIVIFSVLGDLTESMYKRQAGIKDSGHILPGHGGILDRLDSITSTAPLFLLAMMQGWI